MKKVLLSTLFLVIVGGVAVAQQRPTDAEKQPEMPKHIDLTKHKKADKSTKDDAKTLEQKKLAHAEKLEAAKNKQPKAAGNKTDAEKTTDRDN